MDSGERHYHRPLTFKLAIVCVFTLARLITVIVRSRSFGGETDLDASWLMGLATYLQQGALSGRDFHFTYGPAAQMICWAATSVTGTGSAFDAYRMMGVMYGGLTALTLGAVLLLYDRISWKHTALVYSFMLVMNLFSEIPSIRSGFLLLSAAFAYRTVAAGTARAQALWAAACGLLCFASQLITPDIAIMGAVVVVGTLLINQLINKNPGNVSLAAIFIGVIALLNVGIAVFFKLSSPDYEGIFDYQRYIVETMRGYNNTMGTEWGLDKIKTNFFALFVVYAIVGAAFAVCRCPPLERCLIAGFMLAALLSLKGAFIRSDLGHITFASGPFVFAFLLLAKKDWQPKFGRFVWPLVGLGLLWVWPWVHWNAFDFYKGLNGELPAHAVLREISNISLPAESILPPHLVTPEFSARRSVPILPFPYQNYIPALLKRPLLAPVLQSYSASTPALQRFYIEAVERQRIAAGLDVVYGVDSIAAWPVDSVQAITRVPIIFEYLYRNFGITSTEEHKDGHYVLSTRETPKEIVLDALPFTDDRTDDAAGILRLSQQSACGLVRLNIKMTYSWRKTFLRPSGIEILFRQGSDVIASTAVRASEPNDSFTTYVSLMRPAHFHKLFKSGIIPTRAWDNLAYRQAATDQLSARPRKIEISRLHCVDPHIFVEGDASWESSDLQILFPLEVMGGIPKTGYAVVIPNSDSRPAITARLGFAGGIPKYADAPVGPATSRHEIKLASVIAKDVGIGIVNPQSGPISVEINYGAGQNTRSVTLHMRAGEQVSKFLPELLPLSVSETFSGTLVLRSKSPFSVFALRFSVQQLQTLPIDRGVELADRSPMVFPQFTMQGGWATAFILSNPNQVLAAGRIDFFSSNGNPLAVTMNGLTSSTHEYSVAPNKVSILSPGGSPLSGTQ